MSKLWKLNIATSFNEGEQGEEYGRYQTCYQPKRYGVKEQQGDTAEQAVLPYVKFLHAHRVTKQSETSLSRTIIAKHPTASDKIKCLHESSKLKEKNIFVNDDVSSTTMVIRRTKFYELKRKRSEGSVAYFSGANLVTKRRQGSERSTVVNNGSGAPIYTTPPWRTSTSDTGASSAAATTVRNASPLMSTASSGEQQTKSTVNAAMSRVTPSLDEESFASDDSASTDISGGPTICGRQSKTYLSFCYT